MSYILDFEDYKLTYFAVPKAGNTSIRTYLAPLVEAENKKNFRNIHQQVEWTTVNMNQFQSIKGDRFSFSVVRNPWDRIFSVYKDKVRRSLHKPLVEMGAYENMKFLDFVDMLCDHDDVSADIHVTSQWHLLTHRNAMAPDCVVDIKDVKKIEYLVNAWVSKFGANLNSVEKLNENKAVSLSISDVISECEYKEKRIRKTNSRKKSLIARFGKILSSETQVEEEVLLNDAQKMQIFEKRIGERYKKDVIHFGYKFPF